MSEYPNNIDCKRTHSLYFIKNFVSTVWNSKLENKNYTFEDDFFEVGGNSLIATSIISIIRDTFDVEVPISDFFEKPTIQHLSSEILKRINCKKDGDVILNIEKTKYVSDFEGLSGFTENEIRELLGKTGMKRGEDDE